MPKYCEALSCESRGGQAAGRQRKISFYPFPLHDKGRLEKRLKNMKQSDWYPSKHKVICSEHFTPNSFNVRWGIRYLKHNAVPTIFSVLSSAQESPHSPINANSTKGPTEDSSEKDTSVSNVTDFSSTSRNTSLTHVEQSNESNYCDSSQVYLNNDVDGRTISCDKSTFFFTQNITQDSKMSSCPRMTSELNHLSFENILPSTIANLNPTCYEMDFEFERPDDEKLIQHNIKVIQANEFYLINTINQAIGQLKEQEQAVITIIVPDELNAEHNILADSGAQLTNPENFGPQDLSFKDPESGAENLETEHSYCRQDFDRVYLRRKIAKLQSKIEFFENQERQTLSRLKSLEAVIRQLKQDNLLSDEKLKIIESCCSAFETSLV